MTEIVVCEVRAGLLAEAERHLDAFLEPVEFVQPGIETAKMAGRWRADLRRHGRTLSLGDSLIAATANTLGAMVITRERTRLRAHAVVVESY